MAIKSLSADEVRHCAVAALGFDPLCIDLTSHEVIAAALRRAAGFHCPCSPHVLVKAVLGVWRPLLQPEHTAAQEDRIEALLQEMTAYGDLIEAPEVHGISSFTGPPVVYLAPPRFVRRLDGSAFLLGIVPDHASPLPQELERRVVNRGHTRRLEPMGEEDLPTLLASLGLVECSPERWFREPPYSTSSDYQRSVLRKLVRQQPTEIDNLQILDSDTPTHYYRGRWEPMHRQTGIYVARRPQRYGADLWCVVDLDQGKVVRMLDLPTQGSSLRGCDEAWLLQAAIDAENGNPQFYRTSDYSNDEFLLELFAPVPMWAQRRWAWLGTRVEKRGLIAYALPKWCYDEEIAFLQQRLWLNSRPPAVT